MKLTIAVTGASSIVLAKRLLEVLKKKGVETHLVASDASKKVMEYEDISCSDLKSLASKVHKINEIDASIASGSFKTDGMIVVPCSMKTLGGIASGYSKNLILRAADVCLKQEKKLILVPRETPLNYIHLKNMLTLKKAGATILPANMAFYYKPETLKDMINFIIGKILDSLEIEHELYKRWEK